MLKNKSKKIALKFVILFIQIAFPCAIYHWIEKKIRLLFAILVYNIHYILL